MTRTVTTIAHPDIVSREEWLAERKKLRSPIPIASST